MKKETYIISGKSNMELLDELDLKINKKYSLDTIHNRLMNTGKYYWDEYEATCECDKTIIAWNDDADDDDPCNGGIIRLWRR